MTTSLSKLLPALNAVMKDCGYAEKDGVNAFHKYKYTSEEGLLKALRPALVKHGILLIPSIATDPAPYVDENQTTHIVMEYTLAHTSGEVWPTPIRIPGSGQDKGDKGVYKALTGANKYMLFKLFQIATGDDPEQDHGKDKPEPAAAPVRQPAATAVAPPPPPDDYPAGMDPPQAMERLVAAFNQDGTVKAALLKRADGAWTNSFNTLGLMMFGHPNWFYHYIEMRHPDWTAPGQGINYALLPPKYFQDLLKKFAGRAKQWRKIHANWTADYPAIVEKVGIERWLEVTDDEFAAILDSGVEGVGKMVETADA